MTWGKLRLIKKLLLIAVSRQPGQNKLLVSAVFSMADNFVAAVRKLF